MIRGKTVKKQTGRDETQSVEVSIHNRFDIEVLDSKTGRLKQKAAAENVVCNSLWDRLCSAKIWNTHIHYGDGSGTPNTEDTSLFGFLGYLTSIVYSYDYDHDNGVYKVTNKAVLDETTAVGKVLTEVGIAYGVSATNLVTHAMLRDMNGNIVSIEKTDTDIVNIYATVFCHFSCPKFTKVLGTVDGDGRPFPGLLGHIMGLNAMPNIRVYPSRGYVFWKLDNNPNVSITYKPTQRQIQIDAPRASATSWNYGGIKSLFLGYQAVPEVVFEVEEGDGWYNKTLITNEPLGTGDGSTREFSTKIAFAKNPKVKVDGVEVSSEVEYTTPYAEFLSYFRMLKAPSSTANLAQFYWEKTTSSYKLCRTTFNKAAILENTLWETVGVQNVYSNYFDTQTAYASDDLENWVPITGTSSSGFDIPIEYQNCRYWKFVNTVTSTNNVTLRLTPNADLPVKNQIRLMEAPPEGAVITADYDAICIGKDENHVFDFSVTFQFNEYNEG